MTGKGKLNPVSYRSKPRAAKPRRAPQPLPVQKIVSGGQTGVDRAALDFAIEHAIPHGGWCPRGRRAEDGELAPTYELKETPDVHYPQRTEWNVRDSDGTVIFTAARELTGGSKLTRELALAFGKPCLHLSRESDARTAPAKLREFLRRYSIKVLNVAGPRLSTEPAARAFATRVLESL